MIGLPFCRWCNLQRVRRPDGKFCSASCTYRARRHKRPTCVHCKRRPVRKLTGRYCGKSCALKARWSSAGPTQRGRFVAGGHGAQRAQYEARLMVRINAAFAGLLDNLPHPVSPEVISVLQSRLATAGLALYRHARDTERSAQHTRRKRAA